MKPNSRQTGSFAGRASLRASVTAADASEQLVMHDSSAGFRTGEFTTVHHEWAVVDDDDVDSNGNKLDEVTSAGRSPSNLSCISGVTGGASVFVPEY